jgi:hypothetical protein
VVRIVKVMSNLAGCLGVVLLILALVAAPSGLALADDPPPLPPPDEGGEAPYIDPITGVTPDVACAASGDYSKNCVITVLPVDPCMASIWNQTCNRSTWLSICVCR